MNAPRTFSSRSLALAVSLAVACCAIGFALGTAVTAPREAHKEKAAEGLGTIAWRAIYAPGDVAGMHEHEKPRFVIVLGGGTLRATAPDGTSRDVVLETGSVSIRPAERHALENVGTTRVEVVEIEIP